ncbi:unnamed protein product [Rotaria magnacalcarata]|uniref:Uncharacterized protein n=1 Tax=Rotaria magnacalcarata TaxID=392030 RepID=A0A819JMG0_9BILA|nr:unnamed protein product [Rotaria magnacalcarata]CAF1674535.1 unnamed protein product [Rotaria magnacalcarata]CAF1907846.1 unnamed protein product [Rotaria magnacalcarata]CAF1964996.1 unnamed protein product [Rotaria magnacalcarata]CAF2101345.1 unnamed protein product [Rotaria magnacalcarata]
MANVDSIRAVLFSKNLDPSQVKPYTGLHINATGDLILSTPSLDSYRVNHDPLYRYEGNMSARLSKEIDHRILSYDSLESQRYQSLRMKQPLPNNVTRVLKERLGSVASPRADPSKTIRIKTVPGYRFLVHKLPNQDQTMISQRFNKLSPFVTEHGNNPNSNPALRQSVI